MRVSVGIITTLVLLCLSMRTSGFSLLNGNGDDLTALGGQTLGDLASDYARWAEDLGQGPIWNDFGNYRTLNLSFAAESNLLGNAANANAAFRAFHTWSDANHQLSMTWAGYEPVLTSSDNPAVQLEGPAGIGFGANIDVFARSPGFGYNDGFGVLRSNIFESLGPNPGVIATSVLNIANSAGNPIFSVDIFLNAGYTWRTDGTDDISNGVFDVETVVLHEIGHALGLGHSNRGTNFHYNTQQVCVCWQTTWVMYSFYGLKWELTVDELGGLAFLYPPRLGNVFEESGSHDLDLFDLEWAVKILAGETTATPEQFQALDIDGDDALTTADLALLYAAIFNGQPLAAGNAASPSQIRQATAYVSSQGYDPVALALSVPVSAGHDVDDSDFSLFIQQYARASKSDRSTRNVATFDFEDDIDGNDFITFASCFNGAGKPPRLPRCRPKPSFRPTPNIALCSTSRH